MSNVLIKGNCYHGNYLGDERELWKQNDDTSGPLLWKKIYDSFNEKGILKMTELFQWPRKLSEQGVYSSKLSIQIKANLSS